MPTRVSVAVDLERELLTAEDYLDRLDPEHFADLIDGEIFMHSPVSIRHATLLNFPPVYSDSLSTGIGSAFIFQRNRSPYG